MKRRLLNSVSLRLAGLLAIQAGILCVAVRFVLPGRKNPQADLESIVLLVAFSVGATVAVVALREIVKSLAEVIRSSRGEPAGHSPAQEPPSARRL